MIREETICLGSLVKTLALKGEFIISASVDLDELHIKTELVFLETGGQLVPFFVESLEISGPSSAVLKLEDINSPEDAREWIGKNIFIPLRNVKKSRKKSQSLEKLIGYSVTDDELGPLGSVVSVMEHDINPLIEVEKDNKRLYIPFQEDIILHIDPKKKKILTHTPEGLTSLYQ